MTPLKVAVIGVGHMGRHHARLYSEMPKVELVAVVDTNELVAREVAKKLNTKYYTDYKDIIGKVDAANIAVPTSMHYTIAQHLLGEGIHLLVEKPVTSNLLEAERLIGIAESNSLVLQIGHTERFNPAVLELDTLVHNPIFIEAHRMGHPTKRNLDIGVVLELMIHDINIILSIVNSQIAQIHAVGICVYSQYEDIAQAQILFENGCIASIAASRVSAEKIRHLEITQEDAFLHLDYIDQNIILRKQVSSRYIFDQPKAMYRREFMVEQPLISKEEPLRLELQHFVDCVRNSSTPLVSGRDGRDALALALQIKKQMVISPSKENKLTQDLLMLKK